MKLALVVSSYHAFVTDRLEAGARACAREAGVADADIVTFRVPGAFEIPFAAQAFAQREWKRFPVPRDFAGILDLLNPPNPLDSASASNRRFERVQESLETPAHSPAATATAAI